MAQFGSALPWHGRGRRFDPDQVHQSKYTLVFRQKLPSSAGFGRRGRQGPLEASTPLTKLPTYQFPLVWKLAQGMPEEWWNPTPFDKIQWSGLRCPGNGGRRDSRLTFGALIDTLYQRRSKIRDLITAFRNATRGPFPQLGRQLAGQAHNFTRGAPAVGRSTTSNLLPKKFPVALSPLPW